jgi:hypothetical protein
MQFFNFLLSEKITKDGYFRVKEFNIIRGIFNIIRGIKNYVAFLTFFYLTMSNSLNTHVNFKGLGTNSFEVSIWIP